MKKEKENPAETTLPEQHGEMELALQTFCLEADDGPTLFRDFSDHLIKEGACKSLALIFFELDKKLFSTDMEQDAAWIESLQEADFFFLEELPANTLSPAATGGELFSKNLPGHQFFPIFRDQIPYAVFIVGLPEISRPFPFSSCIMLFLTLEHLLTDPTPEATPQKTESPTDEIRKRNYELDSISRASLDFSTLNPDELFNSFLLNIIGVTLCEGAALFLTQNQQGNEFMLKASRGIEERVSKFILHDKLPTIASILKEKKPLLLDGFNPNDLRERERDLIESFDFSVVFPMLVKGNVEGLLFLGRRLSGQTFSGHVMDAVELLLNQVGMAIESNRLNEIKFAFSRYVTNQLIDELLENPDLLRLGGTQRDVTVLFADIRNFTSMSESLPPEDVVAILNTYMSALTEVIFRYGGTIDKYIGDCLMATFGIPIQTPDSQERAVLAAIEMQKTVTALNTARKERGEKAIHIGIGINTGVCISGNMGSTQRMDYTVIGDNVNIAARLEQMAKPKQILITGPLLKEVRYLITAEKLPAVALKGKSKTTDIWEVKELVSDRIINFLEQVDPARKGFYKQVFRIAQRLGEALSLPADQLKKLRVCLYLYDIGMLKLPPALQANLGPYSAAERKTLKTHPGYGKAMLKKLRFFPMAISAAAAHHERWDGSGYPEGLTGEAIPLFARIIGIVESFVAMISTKEFREPLSPADALTEIQKNSGTLYDPALVTPFLDMMG